MPSNSLPRKICAAVLGSLVLGGALSGCSEKGHMAPDASSRGVSPAESVRSTIQSPEQPGVSETISTIAQPEADSRPNRSDTTGRSSVPTGAASKPLNQSGPASRPLNPSGAASEPPNRPATTSSQKPVQEEPRLQSITFNGTKLTAPAYTAVPEKDAGAMKAIRYKGLDYMGHSTEVFAYIGYPENASKTNKLPAVVLAHGGGGTAYADWVRLWVNRGYIAIAMDLEGHMPDTGTDTYAWSGPANQGMEDITIRNEPEHNQWMYHAVADVYLARLLLAADERVDDTRVGVVGISWGGVITAVAIAKNSCFAFAAPIYGCGFLNEDKSWMGALYTPKVTSLWDASNWLSGCTVPTLWVCGDNDTSFDLNIITKSAALVKNSTLCFVPGLEHGHNQGWDVPYPYDFADSVVKGGKGFIKITKQPTKSDPTLTFTSPQGVSVKSAEVHYSSAGYWNVTWSVKALYPGADSVAVAVPGGTKYYYVLLKDNNGNAVTSALVPLS